MNMKKHLQTRVNSQTSDTASTRSWGRGAALAFLFAGAAMLTGCATTNQKDPLEPLNRAVFGFNDAVDAVALKPAATVYKKALPSFVQTGVGNFFGNLADVWTVVNDVLQGKLENGLTDMMRVAVNSTFGLAGLLDIGSEAGLPKHKGDFGQTLGIWGVKSGPYVVLPLFGPSTLRDTLALSVDLYGDPWSYAEPSSVLAAGSVVRVIDLRASVLSASNLIEEAALDRYAFFRDAHLQRRESKIHNDGDWHKDTYDNSSLVRPEQAQAQAALPTAVLPVAPVLAAPAAISQNPEWQNPTASVSSEAPVK
jgi:phospholipid-binding lipoprotein MlaA